MPGPWLIGLSILLSPVQVLSQPSVFVLSDPQERNVVTFESNAPLEKVVGTTRAIRGTVRLDPSDLSTCEASIRVALDSLSTGVLLRDNQMREQYLETRQYPYVSLAIGELKDAKGGLIDGVKRDIVCPARVSLHGVTRVEDVAVTATYYEENPVTRAKLPGNLLRIHATFDLKLGDYEIPVPKLVALQLDETVRVAVDFTATDAPADEGNGP